MAVKFRSGFARICIVLTASVLALTVFTEYSGHSRPFIKKLECGASFTGGGGLMLEKDSDELNRDYYMVNAAFESGLIDSNEACQDREKINLGMRYVQVDPTGRGDAGTMSELGGDRVSLKYKAKPTAEQYGAAEGAVRQIQAELQEGSPKVSLYRRIDWRPVKNGAYAIALIWLVFGTGVYIARGFSP